MPFHRFQPSVGKFIIINGHNLFQQHILIDQQLVFTNQFYLLTIKQFINSFQKKAQHYDMRTL